MDISFSLNPAGQDGRIDGDLHAVLPKDIEAHEGLAEVRRVSFLTLLPEGDGSARIEPLFAPLTTIFDDDWQQEGPNAFAIHFRVSAVDRFVLEKTGYRWFAFVVALGARSDVISFVW